jgi:FkbM family methyltransferase
MMDFGQSLRSAKRFFKKQVLNPHDISIEGDALKKLLADADLAILDVGARGKPLAHLKVLAPYTHIFLCEPEDAEAMRLEKKLKSENFWKAASVVKDALASQEGEHVLYVTRQNGLSSLLKPNRHVVENYSYQSRSGASLRPDWDIVSEQKVHAITLDHAAQKYNMKNLALIKLDTQGSELDILKSGAETLKNCGAVYVELEFKKFYEGQPLFSDVDIFLREKEFEIADIFITRLRRSTLAGSYARKEPVWSHALYFKISHNSVETVLRTFAIALAFHHFDFALSLLRNPLIRTRYSDAVLDSVAAQLGCHAQLIWNAQKTRFPKERLLQVERLEEKDSDREL